MTDINSIGNARLIIREVSKVIVGKDESLITSPSQSNSSGWRRILASGGNFHCTNPASFP